MSRYSKSDYINREMAADCIVIECDGVTLEQARQAIKDCPSADVMPVKHGHWTVKHPEYMRLDRSTDVMECSVCGHRILRRTGEIANYCPNCGAKMI